MLTCNALSPLQVTLSVSPPEHEPTAAAAAAAAAGSPIRLGVTSVQLLRRCRLQPHLVMVNPLQDEVGRLGGDAWAPGLGQ